MNACAAQKVEQEGFDVVVAVVRHGNIVEFALAPQRVEPFVAQSPRRHFYAFVSLGCRRPCVEPHRVQAHAALLAKFSHEPLIALALLATQLKITVRRLNLVTPAQHTEQQRHGVSAATQSHKVTGRM